MHLTQPVESGMDKTASMFDISQMIARARSGKSAHTYKKNGCPAGVTDTGVTVRLDFEAWPSSPMLPYTLEANIGEISPATIIEEYTEFSLIFDKTDVVELDFILESISSYAWETPCYTAVGEILPYQQIVMEGLTTIRAAQSLSGVVRIKGKKIGARHQVTHHLIKSYPVRPDEPLPDEGITADDLQKYWAYTDIATWNGQPINPDDTVNLSGLSIDNLSIVITAKWFDNNGEEASSQMRLTIPQCVQDLLSICDGNLENFGGSGDIKMCDQSDNPEQLTVYVSGCTDKVLDERSTKNDPDSWCE